MRILIGGSWGFTPFILLASFNSNAAIRMACDLSFILAIWWFYGDRSMGWIVLAWIALMFVMAMPSEARLWLPILLFVGGRVAVDDHIDLSLARLRRIVFREQKHAQDGTPPPEGTSENSG